MVTTHPLPQRRQPADDGSFGSAVAAAALHTRGIPMLRPVIGVVALAAALIALVAVWWHCVGARTWRARRRKDGPRVMIDIPLADEPGLGELALRELGFEREHA
jgi:hypothetical protein